MSVKSHNVFHQAKYIFLLMHLYIYIHIYVCVCVYIKNKINVYSLPNMMETIPRVWWNYLLISVSTAVMEGSVCARYSTFSNVHIMQQSLLYMDDHLQQSDRFALELQTHLFVVTCQQYISWLTMFGQMLYSDCISYDLYMSFLYAA